METERLSLSQRERDQNVRPGIVAESYSPPTPDFLGAKVGVAPIDIFESRDCPP